MPYESITSPDDLLKKYPLKDENKYFIESSRTKIKNILDGSDKRLLIVMGPCSIHDLSSTLEYAKKFKKLADEVSDHFYLVMRAYLEKPRTNGGWKGFLVDPYLNNSFCINEGLRLSRQLLLQLVDMQIPVGCELLELSTHQYIGDLISWGCIGARTTTSQPHRLLASHLPLPIGFKNTIDGNIDHCIHALLTAQSSHAFLNIDGSGKLSKVISYGNAYCHTILRGQETRPNFDEFSIEEALKKIKRAKVRSKLLIDCSHDNCKKIHSLQKNAFESVLSQVMKGNDAIFGMMLESHLNAGNQTIPPSLDQLKYGVSVTDPCLDWDSTELLIKEAFAQLDSVASSV